MVQQKPKAESDAAHVIQSFFQKQTPFSVPMNTVLIRADTRPSFIFFIQTGLVKQTVITKKGQELILNLYKPGSFFTLIDGIADIPNAYAFTSLLPTSGWKAPSDLVKTFVKEHSEVSFDLNIRLLKGLQGMLEKTETLMEKDAGTLILQTLLTLDKRSLSDTPLTHQEIADITGLSRETVTRELSFLTKSGHISIQDHMITVLM